MSKSMQNDLVHGVPARWQGRDIRHKMSDMALALVRCLLSIRI